MPHPDTFFIKPAPNMSADPDPATGERPCLRIPDPKTGDYLPEGGVLMPRSGYWIRRLKDGDVVLASAPAAKEGPQTPTPPQSGQPVNPEPVSEPAKTGKAAAGVPAKKE